MSNKNRILEKEKQILTKRNEKYFKQNEELTIRIALMKEEFNRKCGEQTARAPLLGEINILKMEKQIEKQEYESTKQSAKALKQTNIKLQSQLQQLEKKYVNALAQLNLLFAERYEMQQRQIQSKNALLQKQRQIQQLERTLESQRQQMASTHRAKKCIKQYEDQLNAASQKQSIDKKYISDLQNKCLAMVQQNERILQICQQLQLTSKKKEGQHLEQIAQFRKRQQQNKQQIQEIQKQNSKDVNQLKHKNKQEIQAIRSQNQMHVKELKQKHKQQIQNIEAQNCKEVKNIKIQSLQQIENIRQQSSRETTELILKYQKQIETIKESNRKDIGEVKHSYELQKANRVFLQLQINKKQQNIKLVTIQLGGQRQKYENDTGKLKAQIEQLVSQGQRVKGIEKQLNSVQQQMKQLQFYILNVGSKQSPKVRQLQQQVICLKKCLADNQTRYTSQINNLMNELSAANNQSINTQKSLQKFHRQMQSKCKQNSLLRTQLQNEQANSCKQKQINLKLNEKMTELVNNNSKLKQQLARIQEYGHQRAQQREQMLKKQVRSLGMQLQEYKVQLQLSRSQKSELEKGMRTELDNRKKMIQALIKEKKLLYVRGD